MPPVKLDMVTDAPDVALPPTTMPVLLDKGLALPCTGLPTMVPVLRTPPAKVSNVTEPPDAALPPTTMPGPLRSGLAIALGVAAPAAGGAMMPSLVIPPENEDNVTDWLENAFPPTKIPVPADSAPPLLMPPAKTDIAREP